MPRLPDSEGKRALARVQLAHQRALAATADFRRAVVEAHDAGCSVRLIGERVGMSHQRIHQILLASKGGATVTQPRPPTAAAEEGAV